MNKPAALPKVRAPSRPAGHGGPRATMQEAGRLPASLPATFGHAQLRALGQRLRQIRETRTWSLKRLAAESGVSVAAIQKIEVGATNTSLLTVLALSEALGEPMDRLVRTSQLDTRTPRFVHLAVPRRPASDLELTGTLADAHLRSRVVVLHPGARQHQAPVPAQGPMFAYVLSGKLEALFADGITEKLGTGDAVHLGVPEQMTWINPHKAAALVLCVTDPRDRRRVDHPGDFK